MNSSKTRETQNNRLEPGHPALDFGMIGFAHLEVMATQLDGTRCEADFGDPGEVDQYAAAGADKLGRMQFLGNCRQGTLYGKALCLGLQVGIVTVSLNVIYLRERNFYVSCTLS